MVSPKIIYQDESIAVVDKPAGMIVNRADTAKNQVTLQEWAEKKFQISNLKFKISDTLSPSDNFINRAGIVHRLDKETSGILIIAKNQQFFNYVNISNSQLSNL